MSNKSLSENQLGGVLTEFVIVIPMLIVFFLCLVGTGQLLGHLTWVSQASYIGAVAGASTSQITAPDTIEAKLEQLRDLQNRGQVPAGQSWDVNPTFYNGAITGKPIVTVDVSADVTSISHAIVPMNLGVGVAAPYLVPNPEQFAGLNNFGNPPGVQGCPLGGCVGGGSGPTNPKVWVPGTGGAETGYSLQGMSGIGTVNQSLGDGDDTDLENINLGGTSTGTGTGTKGTIVGD